MSLRIPSPNELDLSEFASFLTDQETQITNESSSAEPNPCAQYARVDAFKDFVPEIHPKSKSARTCSARMTAQPTMLILQTVCAGAAFASLLGLFIWSTRQYEQVGDTRTFFTGSCSTITTWDFVSHVVINILSTLFLGAGNYTMQVLVAPSRTEVDEAHKKGRALDIGIHSASNLRWIACHKSLLWGLLGTVAVSLHLFLNSTIYRSIPLRLYPGAIVTSDFQNATDDWRVSNDLKNSYLEDWAFSIYALQDEYRSFSRIEIMDCISAYTEPRTATRAVILVSDTPTAMSKPSDTHNHTSSLRAGFVSGSFWPAWEESSRWVCNLKNWKFCTVDQALVNGKWTVYNNNIQYCLVGPPGNNDNLCGFHYSLGISIIVIVCMSVGTCLIGIVAYIRRYKEHMHHTQSMVTLGDALAEYLKDRDECTSLTAPLPSNPGLFAKVQIANWEPVRPRWLRAVSVRMFLLTIVLIILAIIAGSCLFGSGLNLLRSRDIKSGLPDLWSHGIGRVNSYMLIHNFKYFDYHDSTSSFIKNTLIVNGFQVVVSFLYLLYNNCITKQLVVAEWAQYMGNEERKLLRVSSPAGMQRSTYMLSLPKRYAAPLLAASTLLHFLISRSIFVVQTKSFTWGPTETAKRIPQKDGSRIGFSCFAILLVITTGVIMLLVLIAISFRQYPPMPAYLPRMATNTAFISAACQRPDEDEDAYLFPLEFMAVKGRRITFSTDRASRSPHRGEIYEQPVPVGTWDSWSEFRTTPRAVLKLIKQSLGVSRPRMITLPRSELSQEAIRGGPQLSTSSLRSRVSIANSDDCGRPLPE